MRPWRRPALLVLPLLGVVGVVLMMKPLVAALEPRLVFFPSRGETDTPAAFGLRYTPVTIPTSDGERLAAWQLEPDRPVAEIVYFHGNGGNLSLWLPVFAALHHFGYRVLAVDYRGYGLSTGTPSEQGLYADAKAVVRHAARHRAGDLPLVFWGRSLGGTVAAAASKVVVPDGLILECAFPDKAAVIRSQPVLRALNVFGSYRFPTSELLQGFDRPVLVVHGEADRIVPFALGREVYDALTGPRRMVALPGADHNDFFDASRADYWGPIRSFIGGLRR